MPLFKRTKAALALSRKARELLYEQALNEFESGDVRRGLWAQALAEADGDELRAKGVYLKLRVQSFADEAAIVDQAIDNLERAGNSIFGDDGVKPGHQSSCPFCRSPIDSDDAICPKCHRILPRRGKQY